MFSIVLWGEGPKCGDMSVDLLNTLPNCLFKQFAIPFLSCRTRPFSSNWDIPLLSLLVFQECKEPFGVVLEVRVYCFGDKVDARLCAGFLRSPTKLVKACPITGRVGFGSFLECPLLLSGYLTAFSGEPGLCITW